MFRSPTMILLLRQVFRPVDLEENDCVQYSITLQVRIAECLQVSRDQEVQKLYLKTNIITDKITGTLFTF